MQAEISVPHLLHNRSFLWCQHFPLNFPIFGHGSPFLFFAAQRRSAICPAFFDTRGH